MLLEPEVAIIIALYNAAGLTSPALLRKGVGQMNTQSIIGIVVVVVVVIIVLALLGVV